MVAHRDSGVNRKKQANALRRTPDIQEYSADIDSGVIGLVYAFMG